MVPPRAPPFTEWCCGADAWPPARMNRAPALGLLLAVPGLPPRTASRRGPRSAEKRLGCVGDASRRPEAAALVSGRPIASASQAIRPQRPLTGSGPVTFRWEASGWSLREWANRSGSEQVAGGEERQAQRYQAYVAAQLDAERGEEEDHGGDGDQYSPQAPVHAQDRLLSWDCARSWQAVAPGASDRVVRTPHRRLDARFPAQRWGTPRSQCETREEADHGGQDRSRHRSAQGDCRHRHQRPEARARGPSRAGEGRHEEGRQEGQGRTEEVLTRSGADAGEPTGIEGRRRRRPSSFRGSSRGDQAEARPRAAAAGRSRARAHLEGGARLCEDAAAADPLLIGGADAGAVPIAFGLILGGALGFVRPSLRLPVGAAMAVVLGVLATVVTGEFKASWAYLLIDIPLVAIAAVVGLLAGRAASVARA